MSVVGIANSVVAAGASRASPGRHRRSAPPVCGVRRVAGPTVLHRSVEASASVSLQQASSVASGGASGRGASMVAMAGSGRFVVGGNWKCNGNTASISKLVKDLNSGEIHANADVEIICAPPMVYLPKVVSTLDRRFAISAQNCWVGKNGAFTGEVSAEMLTDAGIPWVILGHSERRAMCEESDQMVGIKVAYAISNGLSVMACVGETFDERQAGDTLNVCTRQLRAIVDNISPADWGKVVIAYEPVWAIGTGVVATPAEAQDVHAALRAYVAQAVSPEVASAVRIQYGGSVNPGNCEALAKMEDIDGFLVGGASLSGPDFITICNAAQYNRVRVTQ